MLTSAVRANPLKFALDAGTAVRQVSSSVISGGFFHKIFPDFPLYFMIDFLIFYEDLFVLFYQLSVFSRIFTFLFIS
jgi:hypothetical protein